MPRGVINPKGRSNLDETTRDMTHPFWGESDEQLKGRRGKRKSKNPYSKIKIKNSLGIIEMTWNLIFKSKREKVTVIRLMQEQYKFDKTCADIFYYKALNRGNANKK